MGAAYILFKTSNKKLKRKFRIKKFGNLYSNVNLSEKFGSPLNRYQFSLFLINRLVLTIIPVIIY